VSVSIRRATPGDVEFLVDLTTNDDVDPYLAVGRDRSRGAMAAAIERSESTSDEFGVFVIELDGEPAGTVRFEVSNRRSQISDLSGLALHPSARGRGVADVAMRLVQRYLFDDLALHRLQLKVYAFNERGLGHAERTGFVREGVRRQAYRHGDGWVDGILFGLLAEDG
jgi:RimJ/RimL family protein N-acetyltransferase